MYVQTQRHGQIQKKKLLGHPSKPAGDKLHLYDKMRVKMAKYVIKYFESEREKKGVLLPYR